MTAVWGAVLSVLVLAACASPARRPTDISSCGLAAPAGVREGEKPRTDDSQFYLCDDEIIAALNAARPQATETIALADTQDSMSPDLTDAVRVRLPREVVTHRSCYRLDESVCLAAGWANTLSVSVLWPLRSGKAFNYAKLDFDLAPMTLSAWREGYVGADLRTFEGQEGRKAEDSPPNGPAGLYGYISGVTSSHAIGAEWCDSSYGTLFQNTDENGHIQINTSHTTCAGGSPGATLDFLYDERLKVSVDMTDIPLEHWREVLAVANDYLQHIVVE